MSHQSMPGWFGIEDLPPTVRVKVEEDALATVTYTREYELTPAQYEELLLQVDSGEASTWLEDQFFPGETDFDVSKIHENKGDTLFVHIEGREKPWQEIG